MAGKPWWETRREEQRKHAADVSYSAWRAGVGADQNADEVARSFDSGESPRAFVDRKLREKSAREAAEAERLEEQHRLETTCMHESLGGCWGRVEGRGYDGPGTYANFIYACDGHARVTSDGVHVDEDGVETPVET